MKKWENWSWILAVGAAWGLAVFKLHGPTWAAHAVAGVAITAPAYCLWALARLQLGTSFAIHAEANVLESCFECLALRLDALPLHWNQNKKEQEPHEMAEKHEYPGDEKRIKHVDRVLNLRVEPSRHRDAYRAYRKRTWF